MGVFSGSASLLQGRRKNSRHRAATGRRCLSGFRASPGEGSARGADPGVVRALLQLLSEPGRGHATQDPFPSTSGPAAQGTGSRLPAAQAPAPALPLLPNAAGTHRRPRPGRALVKVLTAGGVRWGVLICSFGPFLGCKYSHRESHFQATCVRPRRVQLGRDAPSLVIMQFSP